MSDLRRLGAVLHHSKGWAQQFGAERWRRIVCRLLLNLRSGSSVRETDVDAVARAPTKRPQRLINPTAKAPVIVVVTFGAGLRPGAGFQQATGAVEPQVRCFERFSEHTIGDALLIVVARIVVRNIGDGEVRENLVT